MAIFPGAIATNSDLYIAVNNLSTLLTDNPLTIGATTVNVLSTTGFPTVGFISIDAEIIQYTGITATSFTGCTRGADGTTAASHLMGAQVDHNNVAAHHNVGKDEIIAIETHLGINGANIVHIAGSETITGQKTFSLATLHANGTVALPGLAFSSDPNTGIYSDGTSGRINFSSDGSEVARIENGQLRILTGNDLIGGTTSRIKLEDGSASLPSYAFANDLDTGIYRGGTNTLVLATAGSNGLVISDIEVTCGTSRMLQIQDGTAGSPGIRFNADQDTGIYRIGANEVGFSAGGTLRASLSTAAFSVEGSTRLFTTAGTSSLPSLSFGGDQDTGIYNRGPDELAFATGTGLAAFFNSVQQLNMQSHKGILLANGTAASDFAAFGQIKILQVVQATATAEVSSTSGTYADTGLTANITPSNTANKVLVIVAQNIRCRLTAQTTAVAGLRLTRNSTDLISDQSAGFTDSDAPAAGSVNGQQIMVYLDSPATTSSTTYKTRISRLAGTGTVYAQDGSTQTAGWITLLEVNGL